MAYAVLNPVFAAQFEAFSKARGFAFALLWNPKLYRWVLAQRTRDHLLTHELLQGVPGMTFPRCQFEPLFICSDSENGCLKEPGPWIFREIAKRAHRNDDWRAREEMFAKMREADENKARWATHRGQHSNCEECEHSIATLPSKIRDELEGVNQDWEKFAVRESKSVVVNEE